MMHVVSFHLSEYNCKDELMMNIQALGKVIGTLPFRS